MKNPIRNLLTVAAIVLLAGCTHTKIKYGEALFDRWSFANKVNVPKLNIVTVDTNGVTNNVTIEGYSNDSTEALGVVAESAARGAAKGFKP